jgi:putative transport protein
MFGELLRSQPEIALFLSLAIGYFIGSFKLGPVQLGGVCGTLIVALLLGQTGARIAPDLKNIAFALFIFALGFTGGPQFFANVGRGWRYGLLSIVEMVAVLLIIMIVVVLMHLDAGTAAGLLAGAATESAVIGTATEAIGKLGVSGDEIARMQANVVTAYSVSYLFGLITIVLFTSQFAPLLLRVNLRDEADRLWRKLGGESALEDGQREAMASLVTRVFQISPALDGVAVGLLEQRYGSGLTVEQVERNGVAKAVDADFVLAANDIAMVMGRREALLAGGTDIGVEVAGRDTFGVVTGQRLDVVLTRKDLDRVTLAELRQRTTPERGRGIYVAAVTRLETTIPALPGTALNRGDILTLAGAKRDVERGARLLGYPVVPTQKTDFVFLGIGVLLGMAIGHLGGTIGGISIALGTGGGCLLSGLFFGWIRTRHPLVGSLPPAAAQILKDFGLATFIAAVGLSAGPDAIKLIRQYGVSLPLIGVLMVLVPGLLSLLIGRYLLKLDIPTLLGAIAGQQCSTPAISALVGVTGNSTPVIGYTITYAVSNVLLPLMGPLVVGLAHQIG